jgi:hypothetical protein
VPWLIAARDTVPTETGEREEKFENQCHTAYGKVA